MSSSTITWRLSLRERKQLREPICSSISRRPSSASFFTTLRTVYRNWRRFLTYWSTKLAAKSSSKTSFSLRKSITTPSLQMAFRLTLRKCKPQQKRYYFVPKILETSRWRGSRRRRGWTWGSRSWTRWQCCWFDCWLEGLWVGRYRIRRNGDIQDNEIA